MIYQPSALRKATTWIATYFAWSQVGITIFSIKRPHATDITNGLVDLSVCLCFSENWPYRKSCTVFDERVEKSAAFCFYHHQVLQSFVRLLWDAIWKLINSMMLCRQSMDLILYLDLQQASRCCRSTCLFQKATRFLYYTNRWVLNVSLSTYVWEVFTSDFFYKKFSDRRNEWFYLSQKS